MDETAISNAVQQALNAHSVRSQVKRRGTELHVLLKRSEGHDVDYANLYDIISGTLGKLPLEDTNKLMVYGMVDGTKKPEWERGGVLHIALPVIELEIDDMNGVSDADISGLDQDQPLTDLDSVDLESDLMGLPNSFDAAMGGANANTMTTSGDVGWAVDGKDSGFFNLQESGELTPLSLSIGQGKPSTQGDSDDFKLPPLPSPTGPARSFISDYEDTAGTRGNTTSGFNSAPNPTPTFDFMDDLGDPNAMTEFVTPAQMAPPPTTARDGDHDNNSLTPVEPMNPEPSTGGKKKSNIALLSMAGGVIGLGLIAGGWYAWDISSQSQKIAEVTDTVAKLPPENTRTKPDVQKTVREKLNTSIVSLESVPDRPGYPYGEAQTKIASLKQELKKMDTPDPVVQAKALAKDASLIVQNGPHPSKVWQNAQGKWQQSVALLGKVPKDAPNYAEAQDALKKYRSNLSQVTTQLQRQQKVEALRKEVSPNVLAELKQLKAKGTPKAEFLASCTGRLNNTFTARDAQQVGLKTVKQLTSQLCVALFE
ncbi:MAG: hypothetical protein ACK456_10910 [Pseudanabaenaceae cyanobacterium]|jgi:hypothetical protein